MTFRTKISSKFTPRITPSTNKSNKEMTKSISVTIEKVPPPPLLLAKSKREVNVISKYFQNNNPLVEPKKPVMLYAQALKLSVNTLEVLKIKETFLVLNAKKIN